jgi:hypothetical protein
MTSSLYHNLIQLFPISEANFDEDKATPQVSNGKVFLSFHDKHEHVTRTIIPAIRDSYFSPCMSWSRSEEEVDAEINCDRKRLLCFKLAFFGALAVLVAGMIADFVFLLTFFLDLRNVELIGNILQKTVEFTYRVLSAEMYALMSHDFPHRLELDKTTSEALWVFLGAHLQVVYEELIDYKSAVDSLTDLPLVWNLQNCTGVNCTFAHMFGSVHNIGNYYRVRPGSHFDPDYSPEILDKSVRGLLRLSKYIYCQLVEIQANLFGDLQAKVVRDLETALSASTIAFVFFLVMLHVTARGLQQTVFSVIRSVPDFVLKEISMIFDRVDQSSIHNQFAPKSRDELWLLFSASVVFVLIFVSPVCLILTVAPDLDEPRRLTDLNLVFPINSKAEFLSFTVLWLEFQLKFNETALSSGDVRYPTHSICQDCSVRVPQFGLPTSLLTVIHSICFVLCLPFIAVYVFKGASMLKTFAIMHSSLRYIPERARNTNPVLNAFSDDLMKENGMEELLAGSDYGCVLYFDESGHYQTALGDPRQFLPFVPNHVDDIQQQLINCNCGTVAQIQKFMSDARQGKCVTASVSLSPNTEVNLSLSHKAQVLFVTNNAQHHGFNQQVRKMQNLGAVAPARSEQIPAAIVVIFADVQNESQIVELAQDLEVNDRTNHQIFLVRRVTNLIEDATCVINFLRQAARVLGRGKGAATVGGPLYRFGNSVGFPMLRQRVFGTVYEAATHLLMVASPGQMVIQRELFVGDFGALVWADVTLPDGPLQVAYLP